ncbi:MAG: hypothetical protein Q9213_006597 [Squamulea squamosa]
MSSLHSKTRDYKSHLRCLESLVGVHVIYTDQNLKPPNLNNYIQSEIQILLDLSKDLVIGDVEDANDELDDLKDMAQELGSSADKAGEQAGLLELLNDLIALEEGKLKAQDSLHAYDE